MPDSPVRCLLEFAQFHVHWVYEATYLILCCPLLLLPSIFPSKSNESTLHIRWPKYWSFSFSIIPSNKYSGLIIFRIDCSDLLAVQETLKSLLLLLLLLLSHFSRVWLCATPWTAAYQAPLSMRFSRQLYWSGVPLLSPQESSIGPQFESISSSVLSLLYGLTLTTIHDNRKIHSFDYTYLCWQSDVSAFLYTV